MARIKIRGRKEPIEVDNARARSVKALIFGNTDGTGKADPHEYLDLGDAWAGMVGQVDWIELDRVIQPSKTKAVQIDATRTVKMVPLDYTLQAGESLI